MAELLNLKTPATDLMIEWHQKFMNKKYISNGKLNRDLIQETGAPSKYGIQSIDQLLKTSNINPKLWLNVKVDYLKIHVRIFY